MVILHVPQWRMRFNFIIRKKNRVFVYNNDYREEQMTRDKSVWCRIGEHGTTTICMGMRTTDKENRIAVLSRPSLISQ